MESLTFFSLEVRSNPGILVLVPGDDSQDFWAVSVRIILNSVVFKKRDGWEWGGPWLTGGFPSSGLILGAPTTALPWFSKRSRPGL